jgi:hypothetical protein
MRFWYGGGSDEWLIVNDEDTWSRFGRRVAILGRTIYSSVPESVEKSETKKAKNSGSRSNHGKGRRAMQVVAGAHRLTRRTAFGLIAYPLS